MALTGFWMNGVCFPSQQEAINFFVSNSPIVTGQFLTTVNAVPSGAAAMAITSNTMDLSLVGNAFIAHSATLPLRPCDPLTAPLTLSDIFSAPAVPDVATAWSIAFTLPLILWLTAWGFGVVVNMFKHPR